MEAQKQLSLSPSTVHIRTSGPAGILDMPFEILCLIFKFVDKDAGILPFVCKTFLAAFKQRPKLRLSCFLQSPSMWKYATGKLGVRVHPNFAITADTQTICSDGTDIMLQKAHINVAKEMIGHAYKRSKRVLLEWAFLHRNRKVAMFLISDLREIPGFGSAINAVRGRSLKCLQLAIDAARDQYSWAPSINQPYLFARNSAFQTLVLNAVSVNSTRIIKYLCREYQYRTDTPIPNAPYTLDRPLVTQLTGHETLKTLSAIIPAIDPRDMVVFFQELADHRRLDALDKILLEHPHLNARPSLMRVYNEAM